MEKKLRKCKKVTRKHAALNPEIFSDTEEEMARQKSEGTSSAKEQAKDQKRKKPTRERWLLTRKTWRYMTDAGRRLIPEGAQNRVEDIPKLEAYFQEVCQKEKRFLLWRKSSYPGALNFRVHRKKHRDRKKWGSCREKASSADEAEQNTALFDVETKSGGRFDIKKLRQQFLDSAPASVRTGEDSVSRHRMLKPSSDQKRLLPDVPECVATLQEDIPSEDEERELMDTLLCLLSREQDDAYLETSEEEQKTIDYSKLLYQLKRYLSQSNSATPDTANEEDSLYAYQTPTSDFTRQITSDSGHAYKHPVQDVCTKDDIRLKNRGTLTNECEDIRERINLRSMSQKTKNEDYSFDIEKVNLRSNIAGKTSTEGSEEYVSLKDRSRFQRENQPQSGFTHHSGGFYSEKQTRMAPLRSAASGPQNFPSSTYRRLPQTASGNVNFEGDHLQKLLIETLRRYYSKSGSRDKVISDILTDRRVLEKLYFDLRKARNFKCRSGQLGEQEEDSHKWKSSTEKMYGFQNEGSKYDYNKYQTKGWESVGKTMAKRPGDLPLYSKPPIIEVEQEEGARRASKLVQTPAVPQEQVTAIEDFLKKEQDKAAEQKEERDEHELKPPPVVTRRRSSVDHDDVSPSVSDTIKRYLKMARKKSVDADKVDRFKRVNYDRNLRNIKPKGELTGPGEDDGLSKGCQTDATWVAALKELKLDDMSVFSEEESRSRRDSCRSSFDSSTHDEALLSPPSPHGKHHSPGILSSGQSFLSHLLHGRHHDSASQPSSPVTAGAMQKSKSSSSVVHHGSRIVSKKMWRARSKSQSRAVPSVTSTWTPQGHCVWSNVTGAQVVLADTSLVQLTDLERRLLQKVALAKLQALNLGVAVRVPSETLAGEAPHKPKRRPHLLKRKALTTSFFDTVAGKGADKDKDAVAGSGLVFGIPISQCLENDRLARGSEGSGVLEADKSRLRRRSHHGSRSSCASLSDSAHPEESGSCESLDLVAGSVPGQLDALGSTGDLLGLEEREPGVPSLVAACCRHLEAHGLHTLGIFRVSSSKKRVRQLREVFDSGKETQLDDQVCPHDVATLLKEFFRDLPEPLLCRDLYHAFVRTQRIRNRRLQLEALQHLVQQLPVPNRDTLWALLTFLSKVALHAGDYTDERGESVAGNKMDSSNLATLFAPNILHRIRPGSAKDVSAETSDERADAISVVRAMIDQHQALFTVSAELLDEVYLHLMDSHPEALDHLLRRRGVPTDMGDTGVDPDSDPLGAEPHTVRRVWSREEFLHESAAMGGPDMGMRPRHKERLRHSKKHWWEEAEDGSSDAGSSPRRKSSPVLLDASPSVITASLKIPAPIAAEDDLTPVGATRSRQRHASTSGSDSSAVVPLPRALSPASSVSPPPSWASSPPNSPDGTVTCVDYLPDHPSRQQRAVALTAKEITPVILHKVTFAQAGGEQRMQLLSQPGGGELLPKSASASCVPPCPERDQPPPASISSIGGAVMRSKTADIERILRIHQPVEPADAKKYSKRRYTDARHQTGLLPDCEAPASAAPSSRPVPVYKRRELIASDPSDHETFL